MAADADLIRVLQFFHRMGGAGSAEHPDNFPIAVMTSGTGHTFVLKCGIEGRIIRQHRIPFVAVAVS